MKRVQPHHPPRRLRIVHKRVQMTDMQQRRQDMQVRWLKEAIAAQNREPEDNLDRGGGVEMTRLLLTLALLCGPAHALPPCWPANVGGSGTGLVTGGSAVGQWAGWWCPDGKSHGVVSASGYQIKHPPGPHASIAARLSEYWRLNVTAPPSDWTVEMRGLYADMHDALQASRPPVPVWRVAPNGTATTRPAYPLIDGVIGTKEAGRAPVGQPCDCTAPINRSSTIYCTAPGLPALVTVCRQQ